MFVYYLYRFPFNTAFNYNIGMQRIFLIVLLSAIATKCLAQEATITQSAQRAIESAQFNQNLIIIFIFLIIFANAIVILSNYLIKNQPEVHPLKAIGIIVFSKIKKGTSEFKITDSETNPIPLCKLSFVDDKDNIVSTHYTDLKGTLRTSVPKKCSVIIESFGFAKRIVKPNQISKENFIILKPQEDISSNHANFTTKTFATALLLISIALGIYLSKTATENYPVFIPALIFGLTLINLLIILLNLDSFIIVSDHKNKLLVKQKIVLSDSNGTKIKELETDRKGRIKSILAPGFYKISKPNSISKTLIIRDKGPVHIKLKLN